MHTCRVCHIAGELIKGLNAQCDDEYDDRYIEPEDALCVQIAALCHDLGNFDSKTLNYFSACDVKL